MRKELIIYGVSIGLNRGAILLLTPFMVYVLSLESFGLYSYILVLVQFFAPILGLNIYAGISREGGEDYRKGNYIYRKSIPFIFLATLFFALTFYIFQGKESLNIMFWSILIGGLEALNNTQLNTLRCMNKHFSFFLYSLLKSVGLLLLFLVYFFTYHNRDVENYLRLQGFLYFGVFIFFFLFLKKEEYILFPLKEVLIFSILLIPHSLAQWIISGSGRFFIKNILDDASLGLYTKAFNLSMILMIINSGIGIVLPQHLIRNYDKWKQSYNRISFFKIYSLLSVILFLFLLIGIRIDNTTYNVLKVDLGQIGTILLLNYLGFYLLGYYYYYSNILFVFRKAKTITSITLLSSLFCIIVNYLLIKNFGLNGAAVATLLVYLIQVIIFVISAIKLEPMIKRSFYKDIFILLITFALIFSLIKIF
ncbi:lipopolysaccharide biosynthesis protein [Petrimonas sp.]|uniref:lipopolysaccharide biosynthesis protein n=1 Tax=Petrimonas sp. TaxID=2023866 RepID=UPI003F512A9E